MSSCNTSISTLPVLVYWVVVTTGFANKAVYWSVDSAAYADGVRISDGGKLIVPSGATVESITVTATSIYDNTVTGTATITVA